MMAPIERQSDNTVAIFLFHGVIDKSTYKVRNYTKKHLGQEYFLRILKELKKRGRPLSMEDIINHIQNREEFPPQSFAVTFDDGFENNYSIAAPILSQERVPATFYVTTGFIEYNSMSWIDCIEYCLENAPPGRLLLPWSSEARAFQTPGDKIRLLDEIRLSAKKDPSVDAHSLADDIFVQCGMEPVRESIDALDKKMSWHQVRALNESPEFVVGGHTHTHTIMSFLSPNDLENEISISLKLLKEKAGVMPRHYSYPEGLEHCYSPEVIESLKNHGVVCCPTAIDGINYAKTDLFNLKRIMVC